MLFINITILILFLVGFLLCKRNTAEYLEAVDKNEHKLYFLYPLADWLIKVSRINKVIYNKQTITDSLKALYLTNKPETQIKLYWCKKVTQVIIILVLFDLLSIMAQLSSEESVLINGSYIKRPSAGDGSTQVELKVIMEKDAAGKTTLNEKEGNSHEILINVPERRYKEEEVSRIFDEAAEYLRAAVLGNNQDEELICEDLYFCSNIPDTGITVNWYPQDSNLIQIDGTVLNDKLNSAGEETSVIAELSYLNYKTECTFLFHVMPKQYSEKDLLKQKLENEINAASLHTAEEPWMKLPETLEDYHLSWRGKENNTGLTLLLLGMAAACFLWLYGNKELENQLKKRKDQMLLDYPEIVNKFTLLVNAGMTVKQAWFKIAEDYGNNNMKRHVKKRYAYEEMLTTVREIKLGLPENIAYEQYGRRVGLISYIKFSSLISQNLKKGNKGFTEVLMQEGLEAFEERKEAAKRLGEEAGAKLLAPMMVMLIIVFMIILFPAFMSFGL